MKTYSDKDVVPQALFQHRISGVMCGLISNVEMMLYDVHEFPEWAGHELSEGYDVLEALHNMRNELDELRKLHREFIEFLNNKDKK